MTIAGPESVTGGGLPPWAMVSPIREAHIARVVSLLEHWARELELPSSEIVRWEAAGWLHDALRDAPEPVLRQWSRLETQPVGLLHGPAAANRAEADGITDHELLAAVRFHTVGHREWGDLGLALYAADFLEPGRPFEQSLRGELARRFTAERDAVIREIIRLRTTHGERQGRSARPETLAFVTEWSR